MKRKAISLLLVFCMLIPFYSTAHAAEADKKSLEAEVADHIEQIVSVSYSDSPGQYEIRNSVTIYNADTECVYYIIPLFRDQECVGMVELDADGNVTLTDEVTLYKEITELSSPTYLLYTTGGIVYAELPGDIIELYDSGFCIPLNNEFILLSYTDKVTLAEICMQITASNLDVSVVIEETAIPSIIDSEMSLFAVDPLVESENCSITNFVTQGEYNICWAACVATIVNYKNERSLSAVNVATAMGHDYTASDYYGASASETVSALSSYGLTYSTTSSKLSWASVKNNIKNDRPFIVGITSSVGGHMLTSYGYSCQSGDEDSYSSSRYVKVWDPNNAKRTLQYNASTYSIYGYSWSWVETLID